MAGRPSTQEALIDISSGKLSSNDDDVDLVYDALRAVRSHLKMEVAFISEFAFGKRYFRYVDAISESPPITVGDSNPLEESYCQQIVNGNLPEIIPDAWLIPAAMNFPVTKALPVRAHISVPIRFSGGQIYGTFCCFSSKPDHSLDERDLLMMRTFADFASRQIERRIVSKIACKEKFERVRFVLDTSAYRIVYQPIYNFEEERIVGFESLTRFSHSLARSPDVWFTEAEEVGLGEELEMAVIKKAILALHHLPQHAYVSLNLSPDNIANGAIARVLENVPLDRIVLEVTEHTAVSDYSKVLSMLEPLRSQGLRLAVDDAGAGYASFRHILKMHPDLIKLDTHLVRNIDRDRELRALAKALVSFARETGAKVIAEGVETPEELDSLRGLRVSNAQGYFLGRPMEMEAAMKLL
ncbi:sensor domain-containing phosphodiesterase [Synechocystis salina]|uniref:sensor domain-containing phosphodiesterase n=1 Tax=Synechocystis salina TaxID=945780 RepID=UPI002AD3513E|nr:EAL domain-containing protein [Synechocystis salina]